MNHNSGRNTLVIGGRELAMIVATLAILTLAVTIFILGAARLRQRTHQPEPFFTATSAIEVGEVGFPSTLTSTPAIAATMVPTPSSVQHTVSSGESLTSIAILYEVDLKALLEANGFTDQSVIVPGQVLTIPLVPGNEGTYHTVEAGEALAFIAQHYGVSVQSIQQANNLKDADSIYVGQKLYIPGAAPIVPTATPQQPTSTPFPTSEAIGELISRGPLQSDWPRSLLSGDLETNYPLSLETGRFTIHYQPDTYPAQHIDEVKKLCEDGLANAEKNLQVQLSKHFDVYVAGTLFEYPNASLRGFSLSRERKVFILYDGSGTPVDNDYFFTHEITHLVAWNTWGQPTTAMLSEGLATWSGRPILEEGGYLPYNQFCEAIYAAGRMPSMADLDADFQAFNGHIRDPFNYFGSACFVSYLLDTYGLEKMSLLYHSGDYANLYGKSLYTLNEEWQNTLEAGLNTLTIDQDALASRTSKVSEAYAYAFGNYNGSQVMHLAYAAVDRARIALWQGNFTEADRWLAEFTKLTGFQPG